MPATAGSNSSPLLVALLTHQVSAKVTDCDHYRIQGGLAVESDYIITVQPSQGGGAVTPTFEPFQISKNYSAFRTLGQRLRKSSEQCKQEHKKKNKKGGGGGGELPPAVSKLCKYCDLAFNLIDAQRTAYLGKVNFMYVKVLAKQRRQILDDVLSATVNYFPQETKSHPFLEEIATILETFFLTDHVDEEALEGSSGSTRSMKRTGSTSSQGGGKGESSSKAKGDNPILNFLSDTGKQIKSKSKLSVDTISAAATSDSSSKNKKHHLPHIVPITRRNRQSVAVRNQEEEHLRNIGEEAKLLVDDDRDPGSVPMMLPNYSKPTATVRMATHSSSGGGGGGIINKLGLYLETNPWLFAVIALAAVAWLQVAAESSVSMDGDVFLLVVFASFCLGLHTPRPMVGGFDRPTTLRGTFVKQAAGDRSGRKLLRRSMLVQTPTTRRRASEAVSGLKVPGSAAAAAAQSIKEVEEEDAVGAVDDMMDLAAVMGSPMAKFPDGAAIGSHNNCWSSPNSNDFHVRGPRYHVDKKKVPSGDFLFPCRGLDLFLTDACPQNVGRNTGVMGGRLREVPTFIINFRLPWGVLLFYCEIPQRFVPFIEATSEDAKSKLESKANELPNPERAVARWLMSDSAGKNKTLKIVPVVVDGPWVVKSVVGGKPALIGEKLPIDYVYQPAEDGGKKALYVEADLDIAASSAARGVLSVTRSYTQVLTMNLGFVIQGNAEDELPEQMLTGARLHGIDPLTAPSLPPMDDDWILPNVVSSDEDSV